MPWYKVPLAVYLEADDPETARDRALALVEVDGDPRGPLAEGARPVELTQDQAHAHLRMREILEQAAADSAAGLLVSDPRHPGVRFTPAAAAALAALEFEAGQTE